MSSRSIKKRQESCTYKLNRAAIMRMEEGRKKAMSKQEGHYESGTLCIQVENKRHSIPNVIRSCSQSENEESRTEEESLLSEERSRLSKHVKFHTRSTDSSSIRSYKPRTHHKDRIPTDKKWSSTNGTKDSTISNKEPLFESKKQNERRILIDVSRQRKSDVRRRQQTSQTRSAVHRAMTPPLEAQGSLEQNRPKTSHSSNPSSDIVFVRRTGSPVKGNKLNNYRNASWVPPQPKPYKTKSYHDKERKNEIRVPQTDLTFITESSDKVENESRAGTVLPKPTENQASKTNPKKGFDESFMIRNQKMKNELYQYLKRLSAVGVSREPSFEEAIESKESVKNKEKTEIGRTNSEKKSGMVRPSPGSRRSLLRPLTSTMTVSSDQEEVISKWRRRLGTTSPPVSLSQGTSTSAFPPSSFRDSHIFTVQGSANQPNIESHLDPSDGNLHIPEKASPDISLEDVELRKFLRSMSRKRSNEVFPTNEEQEIFLKNEMERTKKQIQYLEELARSKIEKLEAIRWKKKIALEEEAVLNEKLEKLLVKIRELKESDSFAQLLDKQTQVFATKRIRPDIK